MTVIIALENEEDKKVYLGGDSYCSSGIILDKCDTPKVFKIGPFGVGVCGSVKAEQILVKVLKQATKNKKKFSREWIENELTKLVWKEMEKSGVLGPEGRMPDDSSFIIAYDGKAYIFQSDFSIIRSPRGYQAIGAGTSFAKGAMEVLHKEKSLSPEEKVRRGLEASENLCALVMGPFTIIAV